ncbi:MAG: bifunctional precorrin-2 dehydrogenase/sirohydrochlorin ferrochelatase [Lachnospiraceae bacterium]|nr:bifunctional precorrin-2 dehydrogenase/sirohydrochlorin ferrochelatase [Lachnospiraceae bacterium]
MGNVPYFPVFFRLEGRRILVAGGGTIACRRVRTLLNFQPKITVAAPVLCEELEQLAAEGRITVFRGKAQEAAFEDLFLFLACTDDPEENHRLCERARAEGALANNCSRKEDCDFYFPSVVQKDGTVIGINAGGVDHGKVKDLRIKLEKLLDAPGEY